MRIQIYIENSQGIEVCVFNEHVREATQVDLVREIVGRCIYLEAALKEFVESRGEDP